MNKSRPTSAARLYTPRATPCALGVKVHSLKLLDTIAEHVRIRQKSIRHTSLLDGADGGFAQKFKIDA
ncbi:MAG TPA: hypothetical protein VGB98_01395 [Pyrinomonadaceae bacterium]|jgi:hypothetical protein